MSASVYCSNTGLTLLLPRTPPVHYSTPFTSTGYMDDMDLPPMDDDDDDEEGLDDTDNGANDHHDG